MFSMLLLYDYPLTSLSCLSQPPQAAYNSLVCYDDTTQSSMPTMKKAGQYSPGTLYFNGFTLQILKLALSSTVLEMIFIAPVNTKDGTLVFFFAISSIKFFKLLKGLSKTAPFISIVLFRYSIDVTAPIDLPQMDKQLIQSKVLRCSITNLRSYCSQYPKVTYSPQAFPHPLKSKVQRAKLFLINLPRYSILYNIISTHLCDYHYCHEDKQHSYIYQRVQESKLIHRMYTLVNQLIRNLYVGLLALIV